MGFSHRYQSLEHAWAVRAGRLAAKFNISDAAKCARYRNDPIGFCRDILGISPWSMQRELLLAILTNRRVSCVSGHKVGKTFIVAAIALWLYCSYDGARVIFTAPNEKHVNNVLWEAITRLVKRAKRVRGIVIPGTAELRTGAEAGIKDPDRMSEIRGVVARSPEALAGVAGARVFVIVDEASGVEDKAFEPLQSNIAGAGSKMILIGNPTRAVGVFYDSHHSRKLTDGNPAGYYCLHIDTALNSPNITGEWRDCEELIQDAAGNWNWATCEDLIEGLATQEYVDQEAADYGVESSTYAIRVSGRFDAAEERKLFSAGRCEESVSRWESAEPTGRLHIGIDPAGPGEAGDQTSICWRRGQKVLGLIRSATMSVEFMYVTAMGLIKDNPCGMAPVIALDREGKVGYDAMQLFREHEEKSGYLFIPVRSSDKAKRWPNLYHLTRDELWISARDWMRDGGAIPADRELIRQLQVAELFARQGGFFGQVKVTLKKDMIEILKRSPDDADAFCLACWEPAWLQGDDAQVTAPKAASADQDLYAEVEEMLRGGGSTDGPYGSGIGPY